MTKYLINRILRSLLSVFIVVAVVMVLIYTCMDRELIFFADPLYSKQQNNSKEVYKQQKFEEYGYIDYVSYTDYLKQLLAAGEIDEATLTEASKYGFTADKDSELVANYVAKFKEHYEAQGYQFKRLDVVLKYKSNKPAAGGEPQIYAYKDVALTDRLVKFFTGLVSVDNIHNVKDDVGERGLTFTWYDPAYGGEQFSPAVIGNGTTHKYLFYCNDQFPFIHQNLVNINLGKSYNIRKGVDVFQILNQTQGSFATSTVTYPTGLVEESADDLHSATYVSDSLENGTIVIKDRFVDNYTNVETNKSGLSKTGYSFTIGIISVAMSYLLGIPLGILMAKRKDTLVDKLGTLYIVFIIAVPSLAYIFLFKAIGGNMGLPTTFDMENPTWLMYILPVVSLALPSVANLMKWLRRYMIDQMNSDYVKFARSGGLSEGEIFSKHVLKNAIIPIVHGIPGSVLGAMTGAIITERVYVVPGAGNMLTTAINRYDNGVIVGLTLFYALLSVTAIIIGDVLMSVMDPRISFTSKAR
jgi:oligopeptide transport system permease protein